MAGELKNESLHGFGKHAIHAVCLLLALIFVYLTGFCLLYTSVFNPENIIFEHVLRQSDPIGINLLLVVCLALLVRIFLRFENALSLKWCTGIFLGLLFAAGMLWMFSIDAMPRADSAGCYNAAVRLASDQLPVVGYFRRYPFQTGYTLYCELFVRLFGEYSAGKIGYANALFLTLAYAAILAMLWDSKHNKRLQLCAIALLALLIQPVFYVTFVYGLVPGLSFSLWGIFMAQRWVRRRHWWQLFLSGALCAVAIVLKPNYWIIALAIFLMLFLFCIGARRFRLLPMTLVILLLPILAVTGTQRFFEARIGEKLGGGTPQSAWLAMGLQEGSRAAGWYNQYTGLLMDRFDFDSDAANRQSLQDVRERLAVFAADPAYGISFFHNKMVSQWGETTFESIWVNKTLKFSWDPPAIVQSILAGEITPKAERYMDGYTILLFLTFAAGLILFIFGKGAKERLWTEGFPFGVLATVVFGGWLYHMLFEAKSQYLVIYLPMMIPFAATVLSAKTGRRMPEQKG